MSSVHVLTFQVYMHISCLLQDERTELVTQKKSLHVTITDL